MIAGESKSPPNVVIGLTVGSLISVISSSVALYVDGAISLTVGAGIDLQAHFDLISLNVGDGESELYSVAVVGGNSLVVGTVNRGSTRVSVYNAVVVVTNLGLGVVNHPEGLDRVLLVVVSAGVIESRIVNFKVNVNPLCVVNDVCGALGSVEDLAAAVGFALLNEGKSQSVGISVVLRAINYSCSFN